MAHAQKREKKKAGTVQEKAQVLNLTAKTLSCLKFSQRTRKNCEELKKKKIMRSQQVENTKIEIIKRKKKF